MGERVCGRSGAARNGCFIAQKNNGYGFPKRGTPSSGKGGKTKLEPAVSS